MSDLQTLVDLVQNSIKEVREDEFESRKSDAIAAASLEVQLELASYLANAELQAKNAKASIDLVAALAASGVRQANAGKRVTEAVISETVDQDDKVIAAKKDYAEREADFKKWQYIFNTMKDAHIFFRNLDK